MSETTTTTTCPDPARPVTHIEAKHDAPAPPPIIVPLPKWLTVLLAIMAGAIVLLFVMVAIALFHTSRPVPPPPEPHPDWLEPTVDKPVSFEFPEYQFEVGVVGTVRVKTLGKTEWVWSPNDGDKFKIKSGVAEFRSGGAKGVFWLGAYTTVNSSASKVFWVKIKSGMGPLPSPPFPPDPPEPPIPAPIPDAGFRVLITYETGSVTAKQKQVMMAKEVRDYLNAKCAMGLDGKTKEWRMWDKDTDPSGDSKLWQAAFARPKASYPWILISNGKDGHEGSMPETIPDMLNMLKKYGE